MSVCNRQDSVRSRGEVMTTWGGERGQQGPEQQNSSFCSHEQGRGWYFETLDSQSLGTGCVPSSVPWRIPNSM